MTDRQTPYDWFESKAAFEKASIAQRHVEEQIKESWKEYGAAERAYRLALAQEILRLRADGIAVTIAQDLARGEKHVAELRFKRDVAEGVREAAGAALWRHTAQRKELQQLVAWSMRVAPDGQYEPSAA